MITPDPLLRVGKDEMMRVPVLNINLCLCLCLFEKHEFQGDDYSLLAGQRLISHSKLEVSQSVI